MDGVNYRYEANREEIILYYCLAAQPERTIFWIAEDLAREL